MDKMSEHQELVREARELDQQIKKFNLSEEQRKRENCELLHVYNDTKDCAQLLLGSLAELEGVSLAALYKQLDINIKD